MFYYINIILLKIKDYFYEINKRFRTYFVWPNLFLLSLQYVTELVFHDETLSML